MLFLPLNFALSLSADEPVELIYKNSGEWRYPRDCSREKYTCEYSVNWVYKPRTDNIHFTIVTKHIDTWTGIGFSKDERMVMYLDVSKTACFSLNSMLTMLQCC